MEIDQAIFSYAMATGYLNIYWRELLGKTNPSKQTLHKSKYLSPQPLINVHCLTTDSKKKFIGYFVHKLLGLESTNY